MTLETLQADLTKLITWLTASGYSGGGDAVCGTDGFFRARTRPWPWTR